MKSTQSTLSENDRSFIAIAAQGGMAEIKLSELVNSRAECDEIKQFGQHMVQDHGQASQELKQLASQKGVMPQAQLDARHQNLYGRLSNLSGENFDCAYISVMVEDHQQVIAAFERETKQGQDQDLKDWASKTLPTLREHLRMAQEIAQAH
jgi:putative membrane protein